MSIIDSSIEWLKDESTGVPVGFKKRDGTEGLLVTATTNLTGGIEKLTAGDADILIISDQPPNDADGRAVGTIYFQTQG